MVLLTSFLNLRENDDLAFFVPNSLAEMFSFEAEIEVEFFAQSVF